MTARECDAQSAIVGWVVRVIRSIGACAESAPRLWLRLSCQERCVAEDSVAGVGDACGGETIRGRQP